MRAALDRVHHTPDPTDVRPFCLGIWWAVSRGELVLSATNGLKLAQTRIGIEGDEAGGGFMLPLHAVLELARLLSAETGAAKAMTVCLRGELVEAVLSGLVFCSACINSRVPEVARMLREAAVFECRVEPAGIEGLLEHSGFIDESVARVRIAEGRLSMSAWPNTEGAQIQEYAEVIAVTVEQGGDAEIHLVPRQLRDVTASFGNTGSDGQTLIFRILARGNARFEAHGTVQILTSLSPAEIRRRGLYREAQADGAA